MYKEISCDKVIEEFYYTPNQGPYVHVFCYPESGPIVLKGRLESCCAKMRKLGVFHYRLVEFYDGRPIYSCWDICSHFSSKNRYLLVYGQQSNVLKKGLVDKNPSSFKWHSIYSSCEKLLSTDRPKWHLIKNYEKVIGTWRKLPNCYLRELKKEMS